jgi:hypothetical protein
VCSTYEHKDSHEYKAYEDYKIIKNISSKEHRDMTENPKNSKDITYNEYFEVDGIFCSFNCKLAFLLIEIPKGNKMYKDSHMLIDLLFKKSVGRFPYKNEIKPSPHWRLLKLYGGDLTIEEYRNSFNRVIYTLTPNLIRPLGRVFEKYNVN